jgi:hypothetical protein
MKRIVLYDMPTNFEDFHQQYSFVNANNIVNLTTNHFLHTGIYMLKNYKYFSIDQWIYNTLYNTSIYQSRAYELSKKIIINECINSFITTKKIHLHQKPIKAETIDNTFQKIYRSMSHWMQMCFYDFYTFLIFIKISYSSFFFSEICEFIQSPHTIGANIFFKNSQEFKDFQNLYNIQLKEKFHFLGNNFTQEFSNYSFHIDLDNFIIQHDDLYVHRSICNDDIPNGSLYYQKDINIDREDITPNHIDIYIKPRQYTTAYNQYMKEILQLRPPSSIYSAMSAKTYKDVVNKNINNDIFNKIINREGVLVYENHPIVFYYRAYQITNYKIKFCQRDIYQFFAYNMINHQIEFIKMRKPPITSYQIVHLKY